MLSEIDFFEDDDSNKNCPNGIELDNRKSNGIGNKLIGHYRKLRSNKVQQPGHSRQKTVWGKYGSENAKILFFE